MQKAPAKMPSMTSFETLLLALPTPILMVASSISAGFNGAMLLLGLGAVTLGAVSSFSVGSNGAILNFRTRAQPKNKRYQTARTLLPFFVLNNF